VLETEELPVGFKQAACCRANWGVIAVVRLASGDIQMRLVATAKTSSAVCSVQFSSAEPVASSLLPLCHVCLSLAAAVLVTTAAPELPTKPAGGTASSSEVDQSMDAAIAPLLQFSAAA